MEDTVNFSYKPWNEIIKTVTTRCTYLSFMTDYLQFVIRNGGLQMLDPLEAISGAERIWKWGGARVPVPHGVGATGGDRMQRKITATNNAKNFQKTTNWQPNVFHTLGFHKNMTSYIIICRFFFNFKQL